MHACIYAYTCAQTLLHTKKKPVVGPTRRRRLRDALAVGQVLAGIGDASRVKVVERKQHLTFVRLEAQQLGRALAATQRNHCH